MILKSDPRAVEKTLLIILSAVAVALNFWWQGQDGFNLWDEGYLWYGAQQVIQGAVPIRDFMAYDPGRYYWAAAYFWLDGNTGIIDLRVAVALFQIIGLYAGLWTLSRSLKNAPAKKAAYLCLAAVVLMTWMYPRHKIFDMSISLIIVASLTYLIQAPSKIRYFWLGIVVGMAAVFGRNHGVYGAFASLLAMGWLSISETKQSGVLKGGMTWVTGVLIGYLPVLAMCIFIPGYLGAFVDTIVFMLDQGNTNLPLPVPWPWTVGFGTAGLVIEARWFFIGLCFLLLIAFNATTAAWAIRARLKCRFVSPALAAAVCAGIPYAHFAFARADLGHLAQGIYPTLIGMLVTTASWSSWRWKLGFSLVVCMLSVFILAAWQPGVLARTQPGWRSMQVSDSTLTMDPSTAEAVDLLRDLTRLYAVGRPVLVLPFWPGAYPLLDRQAPLWEIYALSPRSERFQREEIERIKKANPGFALVMNVAMDGREELRFSNSHRLVDEYIKANFDAVADTPNPAYQIYSARSQGKRSAELPVIPSQ